ncbi:hypothetical protein [Emticicia sp. BO119]|uniref:hypothetical protein n=1 Tax=Emticicia sp. BO119 TaxID=2757768 RepID=UPI0015EFFB03|nr:hypothetical protein [Emticicia sp. BO119]MBA4851676.1 hypothetical protein [Emticicia sp. BO119]
MIPKSLLILILIIIMIWGFRDYFIYQTKKRNEKLKALQESYDNALKTLKESYEAALKSEDKAKALEAGRKYYSFKRNGELTIYDEQAITNDLMTMK